MNQQQRAVSSVSSSTTYCKVKIGNQEKNTWRHAYTHIASLLNPGSLTSSLYSLCTVSTEIHASFDGGSCAKNGSYGLLPCSASSLSGGGGGVSTCGGAGGGKVSDDIPGVGVSLRARMASRSQKPDTGPV